MASNDANVHEEGEVPMQGLMQVVEAVGIHPGGGGVAEDVVVWTAIVM